MKSLLILISSSPHRHNATMALKLAKNLSQKNEVGVFFLQDGVYHTIPDKSATDVIAPGMIKCYCLLEDLLMRGFSREDLNPRVNPSNYEGLVELMMEIYDTTIGIF